MKFTYYILLLSLFCLFCDNNSIQEDKLISINFDSDLKKLGESKIYFGHQSVGGNIINGLSSLIPKFPVVEMNDDMEISGSYLLHSPIGKNEDPESKCADFLQKIELLAGKIDIAMFKFCYIDINRKTNVESLFNIYQSTIEKVNNQYYYLLIYSGIFIFSCFGQLTL